MSMTSQIQITAWGKTLDPAGWAREPYVRARDLSKQVIRNRWEKMQDDIENEIDPPRYATAEIMLSSVKKPGVAVSRRRHMGKRKKPIKDWELQVLQPLREFLEGMNHDASTV